MPPWLVATQMQYCGSTRTFTKKGELRRVPSDQTNVNEVKPVPSPSHDEIALRAYELWEERGRAHGSDQDDWYLAEQELRAV